MIYDCVIVGSGPAGLTAGIYLARANKKVAIIEKMAFGGQVAEIGMIENYPGFSKISGSELSMNMYKQAKELGVEFIIGEALSYEFEASIKKVNLQNSTLESSSIILAIGSVARPLNVKNENKFIGKGISYCATCDGNFFKGKTVAVVGSGDSAISNAVYLSNVAKKVYIISKNSPMKLQNTNISQLQTLTNVEILLGAKVIAIIGDEKVEAVTIESEQGQRDIILDGIFVSVGRNPDTENLKGVITLDEKGYILADKDMKTNIEGVFASGDIVSGMFKQIVTACSSGAVASVSVLRYLNDKKENN